LRLERIAWKPGIVPALGGEGLLPASEFTTFSTSAVIAAVCSALRPGPAQTPRQFCTTSSTPASVKVGASMTEIRSGANAKHAQGARLDLGLELAVARDAHCDLVPENRRQGFAAPEKAM